MTRSLQEIAKSASSTVEKRLFAEYGAMFVTAATPPPTIVFTGSGQVEAFQTSLMVSRGTFGVHEIELQAVALEALTAAATAMAARGGSITARAADAGGRSYEDTVSLWNRNVTRGLEHWQEDGRISPEFAETIRELTPAEQIAAILK